MHELRHVFKHVVHGLDNAPLAQHYLVIKRHQCCFMLERSPVSTCIPSLQSRPKSARAGLVIMLEVAVGVEVETDEDCDDLGVRHLALATAFWGIQC